MKMLKTALCLSVSAFILCMGSSNAAAYDTSPDKHTLHIHTPELKSAPSYQLASITWLPDYDANEKIWGKYIIKTGGGESHGGGHNQGDGCDGFDLTSCPTNGDCDKCAFGEKYKFLNCKSPYIANGNSCICPASVTLTGNETCSQYCDKKCIAKGCIPTPSKTDCSNGTVSCDDGCGGTRNCCNPCTHTVTTKPEHSIYTYTPCTDNSGTNNIQTGWECENGYIKSDTGDTCVGECNLPTCANAISSKPDNSSYTTASCTDCSGTTIINTGWACDSGYTKSGNSCIPNKEQAPLPILYGDGTVTKDILKDKTAIGIVFDEANKLAIAGSYISAVAWQNAPGKTESPLYINQLNSCEENTLSTCDNKGQANTETLRAITSRTLPIVQKIDAYEPTACSVSSCKKGYWFIPSMHELSKIYAEKNNIIAAAIKFDELKELHTYKRGENLIIWSSNKKDDINAWGLDLISGSKVSESMLSTQKILPIIKYEGGGSGCSGKTSVINTCPINATCTPYSDCPSKFESWKCNSGYRELIQNTCSLSPLPILYGDGTVSKEFLDNKHPIGIVINESKKIAIALKDAEKYVPPSSGLSRGYEMKWEEDSETYGNFGYYHPNKYIDVKDLISCKTGINGDAYTGFNDCKRYSTEGFEYWNLDCLANHNIKSSNLTGYEYDCPTSSERQAEDGYKNTQTLIKNGKVAGEGTYTAALAASKFEPYGCSSTFCKAGKWFLPTYSDVAYFCTYKISINDQPVKEKFDKIITALKDTAVNLDSSAATQYWTSSEYDFSSAYAPQIAICTSHWEGRDSKNTKGNLARVRPFIKY